MHFHNLLTQETPFIVREFSLRAVGGGLKKP